MTKLEQYITDYITELEERKKRSWRTIRNYDFYLRRFAKWLKDNKITSIQNFNETDLKKYKQWLAAYQDPIKKVILKKTTQNYHLIALRGFLDYLMRKKIKVISQNSVKLDKINDKSVVYLEKDELVLLLESPQDCGQDKVLLCRDNAILELLFSTGMKVSELANLTIDRLEPNLKEPERIKLRNNLSVKISNQAVKAIKNYLRIRKDKNKFLFIGHDRAINERRKIKGLSARSIERLIERYAKFAGIKKRVTPQVIRHTYVMNQVMKGASLEKLQKQLGFNDLASIKAYLKKF